MYNDYWPQGPAFCTDYLLCEALDQSEAVIYGGFQASRAGALAGDERARPSRNDDCDTVFVIIGRLLITSDATSCRELLSLSLSRAPSSPMGFSSGHFFSPSCRRSPPPIPETAPGPNRLRACSPPSCPTLAGARQGLSRRHTHTRTHAHTHIYDIVYNQSRVMSNSMLSPHVDGAFLSLYFSE